MRNLALATFLASIPMMGQTYTISTFAGGGPNNVSATILPVGNVGGVVNDASGNTYFSSINLNRVFRVNNGTLFVVAGSGLAGSSGDGGPATAASLSGPTFLSLDTSGNLYITDAGNNRVRRVNLSSGVINNFAGNGSTCVPTAACGDGSSATGAQLSAPKQVATDLSGNVYIADSGNNKIRLVNSGGIIITFAGTGSANFGGDGGSASAAQFNAPSGLVLDAVNNLLYISDTANNRVRRISLGGSNTIQTVVNQTPGTAGPNGNGNPALNAQLNGPQGLALDGTGNMFIADTVNQQIRRVAISSGVIGNISAVAGNGLVAPPLGNGSPASAARLNSPTAVSIDSNNTLYIADQLDGMVRTVASPYGSTTNINVIAGNGVSIAPVTFFGNNGLASNAVLSNPFGAAVSADGNTVVLADQNDNIVRSVNLTTGIITTVAGGGTTGAPTFGDGSAATSATLNMPFGVALDSSNNLYIADFGNNKIRKVSAATLNISTYAGVSITGGYNPLQDSGPAASALLHGPVGLAFDGSNNLFFSDFLNNCIRRIAGDTQIITTVIGNCTLGGTEAGDTKSPTDATVRLSNPEGITVNSTGTVIYFADTGNNRVRWVNNNVLNTYAGTTAGFSDGVPANQAQLNFPSGVVLDAQGNLLIGDALNNRVRRVAGGNPNNTISTVAGDGTQGFGGDGGPAASAELDEPLGLAINPVSGAIYVNDFLNNRVRQLSVVCTYTLNPTSNLNAPYTAGNYSIAVTTNPATGCPFTATVPSGIGFLSITSGASGNGSGTVNYSLLANNSGSTRSTTLTVAGQSFNVSQLSVVCTYTLNPTSNLNAPATAANYSITVTTNPATGCLYTATVPSGVTFLSITSGASGNGSGTVNYSLLANTSGSTLSTTLTLAGQSFNVSQLSPPVHIAKTGIFRNGIFVLNSTADGNFNYANPAPNLLFQYTATPGDIPIVGDWNGDGRTKTGVFRNGIWILDYNGDGVVNYANLGVDRIFQYTASPGDIPVVGDWNGDGRTKTGVFRNGIWILDYNGDGIVDYTIPGNYNGTGPDRIFQYTGTPGDTPVIGDWNGDGRAKTGIFRNGLWILDVNGDGVINYANLGVDKVFQYTATAGDIPIIGDWNGTGFAKTGIYRTGLFVLDYNGDGVVNYANLGVDKVYQYTATPGDLPVIGDWNGTGSAKTGVYRNGLWILNFTGDGVMNYGNLGANKVYQYTATPGDIPLIGAWILP